MNTPDTPRPDRGERILDHTRLQLSALVDGELAPDEAAFLMRRLRHDEELAGCWERWQLAGELLRGRGGARLPDGFAARVAAATAQEPASVAAGAARPRRWLHWGGGAIAASVALVALLMTRPAGHPQPAQAPVLASRAAPVVPATPGDIRRGPAPVAPDPAVQLAGAAVAVADVPRRVAGARRGNAQAQRAAARLRERDGAAPLQVASATHPAAAPATDPFSPRHALPASRPWPRSLTPGLPAAGAFTVDYGGLAPQSPSFYPFAPRSPQPQQAGPVPDVSP